MKFWQPFLSILTFSLTFSSPLVWVRAQSPSIPKTWLISQKFQPSLEGDSKPVSTGGATRGEPPSCTTDEKGLTPLLPGNKVGLTLTNHPTFFWYTPVFSAKTAEFVISTNDSDDHELYKTTLILPQESGIVGFTLPDNVNTLKIGETYRWSVTVACAPSDIDADSRLEGWVELIKPNEKLSAILAKADPSNPYIEAGIWYEALNKLALRRINPSDPTIKQNWQDFLDSVGLNNISSEPFVNFLTEQK